ncbi:hypothetical protein GCM10009647_026360 [Streptomyces sanglieri]
MACAAPQPSCVGGAHDVGESGCGDGSDVRGCVGADGAVVQVGVAVVQGDAGAAGGVCEECVDPLARPANVTVPSIILTSNKTFSEWGQVFGDEVLATAILDRLLHHCEVVPINGPSYRLKNRLQAIERETDVA